MTTNGEPYQEMLPFQEFMQAPEAPQEPEEPFVSPGMLLGYAAFLQDCADYMATEEYRRRFEIFPTLDQID